MNSFDEYLHEVYGTAESINAYDMAIIYNAIAGLAGRLFICGNGGSAASADHWVCDYMKGINEDVMQFPSAKAISLASNGPLVTAIANDFGYKYIFSKQLDYYKPSEQDLVLTLSVSGNSENVVEALYHCRNNGIRSIALTGNDGGKAGELATYHVNVPSNNYGVVEDIHMMILHYISQRIRYNGAYEGKKLKL